MQLSKASTTSQSMVDPACSDITKQNIRAKDSIATTCFSFDVHYNFQIITY